MQILTVGLSLPTLPSLETRLLLHVHFERDLTLLPMLLGGRKLLSEVQAMYHRLRD
jgi:hypothetical protein